MWRRLVPHLATHALGGGLFDPGLYIWWLKWFPYALTHGLNPLHSTYLDAPSGVSAMWNTSVPALATLFTPVTLIFGPVVTFNLLCILGPPLSAWTGWLWLRRHVHDGPAALGGLVFGFSPFVNAESRAGHLNFTWLLLLPIILMLVEDLLWRSPRPLWPHAPLLGLVVSLQLLIGSEPLLILAFGCIGMTVLLTVRNLTVARQRLRVLGPAAAGAAVVALALCAWPLAEQFGGDGRIRQPVQLLGASGGRLATLIEAPITVFFHSGHGPIGQLTPVENGLYIGWPLLAVLVLTAVLLRRRPGVLIAVAAVVVSADFQMYRSSWIVFGHSIPAPLHLLQEHVALTRDILPGRFAITMWLGIAWLLAVGLDAALTHLQGAQFDRRLVVLPPLIAAACLLPLVPAAEAPTEHLAAIPSLFSTPLRNAIPNGATVMLAPMATPTDTVAELWQVESDMRFRQIGGFMLHAVGADGAASYYASTRALNVLFRVDSAGPFKGPPTAGQLENARAELRAAKVTIFMVGHPRGPATRQLELAEQVFGRRADQDVGGVSIWRISP